MVKRLGSSFASRSNALVGRGAGQDLTHGGGRVGPYPNRPQTRTQTNPQHGVDQDTPAVVSVVAPTVTLPADVVVRILNVLEALVPNLSQIPAPQDTSQTQAQVQLNGATSQAPLPIDRPIAAIGQSKDLKSFIDLKPPEFDATPFSVEPQKFLDRCEKILTTLGLRETRGVEFTTFLFSRSLKAWWTFVLRRRQAGLPPITWSEFLAMFMDRFIPLSKQDDMRCQFYKLRKGSMTVTEYEAKFTKLSSNGSFSEMVDTALRIIVDVVLELMVLVILVVKEGILLSTVLRDILGLVTLLFRRRKVLQVLMLTLSQPARIAPQGARGQGRQGAQGSQIVGGSPRFFAMAREDLEASNAVVISIITVTSHGAYSLIDPGSMYSYVSLSFALFLERRIETLVETYIVTTPVGETLSVDRVYRGCVISFQGKDTIVDLFVLPMTEFDGMTPVTQGKIISYVKARRMINHGCLGFTATVHDTRAEEVSINNVPIVREFIDVFPDDLLELLPMREIEFNIDLVSGTQLISILPYRMAPAELRKLKVQLQELLDKGFIRPSVSPWGAPMLFVKKEDGTMR
ncbi:uncharacterized protein LOC124892639, partial [Capsicum annuum]|uniref:uncharacterized protein LOC124892639 n=1 Tax=Capsicum annuum TaxID=4072 RepID=UPI001FB082A0